MEIDLEKLEEIYGKSLVKEMHDDIENLIENMKYLNKLDIELKVLKMLIRISYKRKYINVNNYEAWSRKITNVSNLMGGWIKSCLKQ